MRVRCSVGHLDGGGEVCVPRAASVRTNTAAGGVVLGRTNTAAGGDLSAPAGVGKAGRGRAAVCSLGTVERHTPSLWSLRHAH